MYTAVRIKKTYGTRLEGIIKYLSILSLLNGLNLMKAEVNILAFTCVYGHIESPLSKQEFQKTFGKLASLNNLIYGLLKKGYLVKEGKKIILNKQLHIESPMILRVQIDATEGA